MKAAAGILFVAPDGSVLLCRRNDGEGWAFPGGGIEPGENAEQAARREAREETGATYDGPLSVWMRRVKDGVDFTTHLGSVDAQFTPRLNAEHDAYVWATPQKALDTLTPVHPGARVALQKFGMNELGIARAVRDGEMTSPQRYGTLLLVAMRVTGTGAAYRPSVGEGEYVWRDPALYLNDDFLERCQGLPVIWEHPDSSMLTSKEFAERVIGAVMLPYVVDSEVWCIARVYDAEAARLIETRVLSTSPAVLCGGQSEPTDDGRELLIERAPRLLDHLAVLGPREPGVWDKGAGPSGVESAPAEDLEISNKVDDALSYLEGWRDEELTRRMAL